MADAVTTRWFVVKHVPDLARREPRNIGVILWNDGRVVSRFVGEDDSGRIDGRKVAYLGDHLIFKAWVRQWRQLNDLNALETETRANRRAGSTFFVEEGGERLVGEEVRSTEDALEDLYVALVQDAAAPVVVDNVRALSREVFRRIGISRQVKERQQIPVDSDDELWFDYRYDNGRPNLMQRVGQARSDKETWDRLHAIELSFQRLSTYLPNGDYGKVVLFRQNNADTRLIKAVTGRLGEIAEVVDVGDPAEASTRLRDLLHVGSN